MRASMSFAVIVAARARDHDFGQSAGVEIDDLVRQHRLDHALDRHAAGLAEIGRAEDRHVGGGAGVLHQIADAHDLADDRHRGLERRAGPLRQRRVRGEALEERPVAAGDLCAGDLRRGGEGEGEQRECGQPDHRCSPQRIIAEVDCSIWSAAEMTLAFIS